MKKIIFPLITCSFSSALAQISYDSEFGRTFHLNYSDPTGQTSPSPIIQKTFLPPYTYSDSINWTGQYGSQVAASYSSVVSSSGLSFSASSSVESSSEEVTESFPNPLYNPFDPYSTEPAFIIQTNNYTQAPNIFNIMGGKFTVDQDVTVEVIGTGVTSDGYGSSYTYFSIYDITTGERPLNTRYAADYFDPLPPASQVDSSGSFNQQVSLLAGRQYSLLVDARGGRDFAYNDGLASTSALTFSMNVVPEPSSVLLSGFSLLVLSLRRRR